MLDDSLTIICPTAGRESLRNTLRSYEYQMGPRDEFIVVGDTTDAPLLGTEAIVAEFDARFRYVDAQSRFHTWGHAEMNIGLDLARNSFVMGDDDDDIAPPNALADIRAAIADLTEPRPLLFQFMAPWRELVWQRAGDFAETLVGGHCLVAPNLPGMVGRFTGRYSGDFDWLRDTIERWPNGVQDVVWVPKIIAWTRPTKAELKRLIPEKVTA